MMQFGPNLTLLEKIASGGMGDVYRAKQTGAGGFQKVVAVKRIRPQFAVKKEFAEMFANEMSICAKLQHPNIVQVFGAGEESGYLYLVMEYVRGHTVTDLIRTSAKSGVRIPPEVSCYIVSEIALALAYAHGLSDDETGEPLSIVHRDVSPPNIMLGIGGEIKLVDFGIAKAANRIEGTRVGDLKGKASYAAPEYLQDQQLDRRADIFALGVVLYELLSQQALFTGETTVATLENVLTKDIPSLVERFPDVRFELDTIVQKALKRDPQERYQTADNLYKNLALFMNRVYPQFTRADAARFFASLFADFTPPLSPTNGDNFNDRTEAHSTHDVQEKDPLSDEHNAQSIEDNQEEESDSPRNIASIVGLIISATFFLLAGVYLVMESRTAPTPTVSTVGLVVHLSGDSFRDSSPTTEWVDTSWFKGVFRPPSPQALPDIPAKVLQGKQGVRFSTPREALHAPDVAVPISKSKALTIAYVGQSSLTDVGESRSGVFPHISLESEREPLLVEGTSVQNPGQGILQYVTKQGGVERVISRISREKVAITVLVITDSVCTLFYNGVRVFEEKLATPIPLTSVKDIVIGPNRKAFEEPSRGVLEVGEVLVYTRALTDAERVVLERHLAARFSLTLDENRSE